MNNSTRRKFLKVGIAGTTGIVMAGVPNPGFTLDNSSLNESNDVNITDFGAVEGGKKMNTVAIQKAIEACAKKGGGRVIVPQGIFLTGSVELKSNVTLHLLKDAILLSSPFFKDFPERHLKNPARYRKYLKRALIYAQGENNISVTGEGIFDGNAILDGTGEFKEKNSENPVFIWFEGCNNVTVKDVTFRRSVWWTQAYSRCNHVHIDHVTVTENYFYNADGCDILDCEDFLVENCDINANDDGICLKGYTSTGCNRGVIRNNKVRTLCNGIKMGTDSSGGFRNIIVENNEVWQTVISGIALQIVDGGIMENITVRNMTMNGVGTPVNIRLGDRNRLVDGSMTVQPGIIRNIYIGDIKATVNEIERYNDEERKRHPYQAHTSSVCGIPGNYIHDVTIENVAITIAGGFPYVTAEDSLREIPEVSNKYPENRMFGTLPSFGFYIRHARNIKMQNILVDIKQKDGRPAFLLDDVYDSHFDEISVKSINTTPVLSIHQNCKNISING